MEMILAASDGAEEKYLDFDFDIDIGNEDTFEIAVPYSEWNGEITFGKRVYIPGTEHGGIVKDIQGDTSKNTVFVRGYTWRGYLRKRWFKGTLSGDLNDILSTLVSGFNIFHIPSRPCGITTVFTADNYMTVLEVATQALYACGFKLSLKYTQTQSGGYVLIEALPSITFGGEISQDGFLDFAAEDNRMGINHLFGSDGTRSFHLYVDANGNVGTTQHYVGMDEFTDFYEFEADSDINNEIEQATEQLKETASYKSISATFKGADDLDMDIGDKVFGIDYITGVSMEKMITKKIITYKNSELSTEYGIEGDI